MNVHRKNDFLIERIAFFSDAVFAIAITLLIIEIHPPHLTRGDSSAVAWKKLLERGPEFLGLAVSFLLIGTTWLRHHQLFKYISNFDVQFMAINLVLLFTIILFPFSTSFLYNSLFEDIMTKPQVIFYLAVPMFSNFILYIMFRRAKRKHIDEHPDTAFHKATFDQGMMALSFLIALIWVIAVSIRYHYFGYTFLGVGPMISALKSRGKKKIPTTVKNPLS